MLTNAHKAFPYANVSDRNVKNAPTIVPKPDHILNRNVHTCSNELPIDNKITIQILQRSNSSGS